ncbi:MAG: NADH-quinone oxidoreductase subunit J, partial [Muribaculaceae bacterium]|nr:NADH-quinone oxidoreductase subunit J [Muribaculaceae bacterium]
MESLGSIITYWVIALAIVVFSILAVTSRKILRSATYLLFALFATAAVYFKLDYEFLGGVQIAVYAGGIVVMVVFAILLTTKPGENSALLVSRSRIRGLVAGLAALVIGAISLLTRCELFVSSPAMSNPDMQQIGSTLMGSGHNQYLLPFEAVSILLLACIIGGV